MKKNYFFSLLLTVSFSVFSFAQDLIITGAFDGSLTQGTPKGVELYVVNDIADLGIYALGSANNGGGTDGVEFTFPNDAVTAGSFIYVATEEINFEVFFGIKPNYTNGAMAINGDDAIELFKNEIVVETFGDIDVDGSGEPWEYLDGWAYRKSGTMPDTSFVLVDWDFSGVDGLEGGTNNATASSPFPIGTYSSATASTKENSIEGFSTFPNPLTNGELTITSKSSNAKVVSIFNVLGKQVFSDAFAGTFKTLNLAGFSSGLYILKVAEGDKIATQKLVIK